MCWYRDTNKRGIVLDAEASAVSMYVMSYLLPGYMPGIRYAGCSGFGWSALQR